MACVAVAILACAWSAGAAERKGPDLFAAIAKQLAQSEPKGSGLSAPTAKTVVQSEPAVRADLNAAPDVWTAFRAMDFLLSLPVQTRRLPPELGVAVRAGRAKTDSVRIAVNLPWYWPAYPAGTSRLYPAESCLRNIQAGLFRRSREVTTNIYNRDRGIRNRMNALAMYFSVMDGGGFGFRLLYDRRLKPALGLNVSGEFTTYGGRRLSSLQAVLPDYTTRVSVIGLFTGLQQRFRDKGRIVPRLGFGAGPVLRVDHLDPFYGYYGYYGPYGGIGSGYGGNYYNIGIPLPFSSYDFPRLSLSAGGYADAGLDIVVDKDRLYAVSLDARYNLIRFFDALGSPGDFGGPALYVGFGRRF
jgi:hypothetical protein